MGLLKFTADSFQNFAARLGIGTQNQHNDSQYGFNFTSRNRLKLEAMYRTSWIVGQAVDVVAEDMTREGINIKGEIKPDDIEKITKAMETMCIWDHICDTIKWGRLYGGAIAVMLIDGQKTETPLQLDSISKGQFKGLMVLDRWQVQPSIQDLVTEYGHDLGMPKFYDVVADSLGLSNQRVHYSRVIRIDGVNLPYWQRVTENLWGQSVIERLEDRLTAFDSTTTGAAQLVYKAHLRTYKVKGLRNIIGAGGKAFEALVKQIEQIRLFQSNEGMTLMDAEDMYEAHQYSFTGLSDMLLQFGQQLSGALQIPLVRLFGQSPAGLNSTGDSDIKTYHDNIKQQQERRLRSPLIRLTKVIARSELGMTLPDSFSIGFNSLTQLSDKDKSDIANTTTTTVLAAEEAGIISRSGALKELRQSSEITGVWTNISDEDINQADDDPPPPSERDNEPTKDADVEGNPNHDPDDGKFTSGSGSSGALALKGKVDTNQLIDAAVQRPTSGNDLFSVFSNVDQSVAEKVRNVSGIDVSNYVHGIDESAVRHIFKHHGDEKTEALRNQVAVTKEDISSLNDVLNSPDSVEYSGASDDGTPTVTLKKKVGNTIVCVQEIRTGRKKLAVKTMWKVRNVRTPET